MKYLILLLVLFTFFSCENKTIKKKVKITYTNGDTELINVQYKYLGSGGIFFNNGCLYLEHYQSKYDSPYKNCVRCGIRSYKILN
jgi:thioredoxin-related protein